MIMNGALRFLANPDDLIGLENYGNSIIDLIIGGVAKAS
jgi:hypothetical protein